MKFNVGDRVRYKHNQKIIGTVTYSFENERNVIVKDDNGAEYQTAVANIELMPQEKYVILKTDHITGVTHAGVRYHSLDDAKSALSILTRQPRHIYQIAEIVG